MFRSVFVVALFVIVLPFAATTAETEQPRAIIGITGGISTVAGGSYFYLGGNTQSFTLGAELMVFHPSWFMAIADYSNVLKSKQEVKDVSDGGGFTFENSAWYIDILAGARYKTGSGIFIYLAAGLSVASGDNQMTMIESDGSTERIATDIGATPGLAIGAGGAIPIGERWRVLFKYRHRLIVGESDMTTPDGDITKMDYDIGGLETSIGFGVTL